MFLELPMAQLSALITRSTELLDTRAAAEVLGVTPRTLEVWRCTKRQPLPYVKVGRLVKYRRSDLDAFIARQVVGGHDR